MTPREQQLEKALREVMEWIKNWEAPFLEDPEWPETQELINAALSAPATPAPPDMPPTGLEPPGCPTPGACSCLPAQRSATDAEREDWHRFYQRVYEKVSKEAPDLERVKAEARLEEAKFWDEKIQTMKQAEERLAELQRLASKGASCSHCHGPLDHTEEECLERQLEQQPPKEPK